MNYFDLVLDLVILFLIGNLVYMFWTNYKAAGNRMALVITTVLAVVFVYQLIFSVILSSVMLVEFGDPFEAHVLILLAALLVLNYSLIMERRGMFSKPSKETDQKTNRHAA